MTLYKKIAADGTVKEASVSMKLVDKSFVLMELKKSKGYTTPQYESEVHEITMNDGTVYKISESEQKEWINNQLKKLDKAYGKWVK